VHKRALIITYYWPPSGGPGVQRWLKFVKYLPEFDIEPIVYVPENPNYPIIDESLLTEVSTDLKVLRQPISEPYKLARLFSKQRSKTISKGIISEETNQNALEKLLLFIRGNFFIPDARVSWVKSSVKYLTAYIKDHPIDAIITTGPPHSLHLIGLTLKKQLGVKWIADFRDPWTTIGYHHQLKLTKKSQQKHLELEKQVLNTASQIIVTSFKTKDEFKGITSQPIEVITNGYDYEVSEKITLDVKFTMSHIGSMLSKRNPEVLWQVLSDLTHEDQEFSNDFQLNFIGLLSDDVLQSIKKYHLSNYVNNIGYVSHKQVISYQKKSQVLLLVEVDSEATKCIIPGKLFEYMVSNRPILALGPKASDVEKMIRETNTGSYLYYDDYNSLKKVILNYYKAYKLGLLKSNPIGLETYSRKSLTKSLSKLI